jgi:phage baseplate assembly protein W
MSQSIAFPFSFVNGRVGVTTNTEDQLTNRVVSVVGTQLGERVMRPNYGTDMVRFDFGLGDEIDRAAMEQEASRAVSQWEPGARGVTVVFADAPDQYGNLYATVSFTPSGSGVGVVTQSVLVGVLASGSVVETGAPTASPSIGASSTTRYFGTQE